MTDPTASQIIKRADIAFNTTERSNAEVAWRDIATFMLPNDSSFIITGSRGQGGTGGIKTTQRIFDGTAIQATRDLASALNSTLTNPATQWAQFEFEDEQLNMDRGPDGAKAWLQRSTKIMFKEFAKSNFNAEKASGYPMMVSMGCMAIFEEDVDHNENGKFNGFQFGSVSINELAWSENRLGVVDTVYRRMQITAKQAVERFGETVSDKIRSDFEKNPDTLQDFLHAIFPRADTDIDTTGIIIAGQNRPFVSAYIERKTRKFVELSGYYEFPMYIVRFDKSSNEQYGRGSGQIALSDTRTLNVSIELLLESAEMAMFPPVLTEDESITGGTDFSARSVIHVDDIDKIKQFITAINLNFSQISVDRLVDSIQKAFFLDKIRLPPRDEIGEMSAFETGKRIEEMQKALGTTAQRMEKEFLGPLALRSFNMLMRGGALSPIPRIIKERLITGMPPLKIDYINIFSRSQRFEQLANVRQLVGEAQQLAAATGNPAPLDRLNIDEIMKLNEEVLGVPSSIINTDAVIKEIRKSREKQQSQQQQVDSLLKTADAASKLQ